MDKKAFRKEAARRRAEAHAVDPQGAAEGLRQHGLAALAGRRFSIVSGFWPIRSEIDPRPLMRALAAPGIRFCLPAVVGPGPLEFRLWEPGDGLEDGPLGTSHPTGDVVEPDLLLVPLLAFDRSRHRIGYGAGHYDATINRLRKMQPILTVGVAYAAQEVDVVPLDHWDEALDLVVTERGVL